MRNCSVAAAAKEIPTIDASCMPTKWSGMNNVEYPRSSILRAFSRQSAAEVAVDADDVGLACREGQHALAPAADDDRRVWSLHGLRLTVEAVDPVVLAVERQRAVGPQPFEHGERLGQAVDAHASGVEWKPAALVVDGHPPRADAELEAAVRQQVDGRGL